MLRVLVVDDEPPARQELVYLLSSDERVGDIRTAENAADALRALEQEPVDAIFTDIRMPGLTGLELARVLVRFAEPTPVVFVTAYEDHAVDAFALDVVDYLLKPVRPQRLADAVRRVLERKQGVSTASSPEEETIPVELGGVTRFVRRREVRYAEASGDYVRLHLLDGSGPLLRASLATLEERWAGAGFVRIHRSLLVALAHIEEVWFSAGRCTVLVGGTRLQVSRRHTAQLRDLLTRPELRR